MNLEIKIEGGYADEHKISLDDIAILSKSIQLISRNYELKNNKKQTTDIYISATKEGSLEILLDLLNNGIAQGVAATYLYELAREIKSYMFYDEKKTVIQKLLDEMYALAYELAEAEYYDVEIERKQQKVTKIENTLKSEYSTFNAIKDISKLVKETDDEQSIKPKSITFSASGVKNTEPIDFSISGEQRRTIYKISNQELELDEIDVKGELTNISRGTKPSFKLKAPFFGTLKIYTDDEGINQVSEYFKDKQIKVKIRPIVKMGGLVKTREAKLSEVI